MEAVAPPLPQNLRSEKTFSSGSFFRPCRNSSSAMKQHS